MNKCSWDGHEKCTKNGIHKIEGHGSYCLGHIKEMAWMYLDLGD